MTELYIEPSLVPYIASQFPRIYQENDPLFIAFVQAYEEWMALPENVGMLGRSLLTCIDIDTTLPQFISHFQSKYLSGTPLTTAIDTPSLVKNVKGMVADKGTPDGVKLFLQLLFNQPSNVYIPGTDILRTSDGVWMQYPYIEVSFSPNNNLLIGSLITGSQSGATAFVRATKLVPLPASNRMRSIMVLENMKGSFALGETIRNSTIIPNPLNEPIITGSLTDITITAGGLGYNIGDELQLTSDKGVGGLAIVNSIAPKNGVVNFQIVDGGGSYANSTTDPTNITQTSVTLTQANTNPGIGATFQIGNLSNTYSLTVYDDFIYPFIQVPLASLTISAGGAGYNVGDELIFIRNVADIVPTGSSSFGTPVIPANNAIATVSTVDANGKITALATTNGGEYAYTPTIKINTAGGTGAALIAVLSTSLPLINQTAYGFAKDPTANSGTIMSLALTSETIVVGTIGSLYAVNPGEGYTGAVNANVFSSVIVGMNLMTTSDGKFDGDNAFITGGASKGDGSIETIHIIDSGVGYVVGESLTIEASNTAIIAASGRAVIGGVGTQLGHWLDTRGFLDSDKYIQDSYYYQSFSYEIQSPMPLEQYDQTVKDLWHMAGTQMFGRSVFEDVIQTPPRSFQDIVDVASPVAGFTSVVTALSVAFTDTSTDSVGTIVSWTWDFGDGTTSTTQNPSHTYASAATYSVKLTVTENNGLSGSYTAMVTVYQELNLLAPTLDPRITFTRATTKTYFDATGTMQTAAINVAPLEYDPVSLLPVGRSFWEARTNQCLQSQNFSMSPWGPRTTGSGAWPTVTPNYAVAPDGTMTADRVQCSRGDSASWSLLQQTTSRPSGATATQRIYAKSTSGAPQTLHFSMSGASPINTTVSSAWAPLVLSYGGIGTNATILVGLLNALNGLSNDVLLWQCDQEVSAVLGPSIPTTTAAVTRAADVATVPSLASIGYNASAGTFVVAHSVATGLPLIGSGSNAIVTSQGGAKIAVAYDGTGTRICSGGGAVTSGGVLTFGSSLSIGQLVSAYADGNIKDIRYYPRKLSDAELQSVTT